MRSLTNHLLTKTWRGSTVKTPTSREKLARISRLSDSNSIFCRAMLCTCAVYAVARCPSVCPSVCLSRSRILSKWINISSKLFHHRVATALYPRSFAAPNVMAIFRRDLLTGASNAGSGVGKNRVSRPMSGFIACCER